MAPHPATIDRVVRGADGGYRLRPGLQLFADDAHYPYCFKAILGCDDRDQFALS